MTTTDAATTRTLHQNLGHGILAIAGALPPVDSELAEIDAGKEIALGKQIDALILAALKAATVGRQTNKQMREAQQKARQGFARALARKVAKLP